MKPNKKQLYNSTRLLIFVYQTIRIVMLYTLLISLVIRINKIEGIF